MSANATNRKARTGMKVPRTAMPEQPADVRNKNFEEVALGYTKEQALVEAGRCLQCKDPMCQKGCPVEIDIKGFLKALFEDDVPESYRILRETTALPAVCGRVCPQEVQCEGACILGRKSEPVAIGRLERFVADTFAADDSCEYLTGTPECALTKDEVKVACIGSGPASLSCAGYLATQGIKVTVFEGLHELGGVLVYGIPEFRLPKSIVKREITAMEDQGVEFVTNWVGGKTFTIDDLFEEGYDAVFVGVGAGLPRFLGVPGDNLLGVFSANEYLTRANLGRGYDFPKYDTPLYNAKNVVVVGGGNVAMDAARTALRAGAEKVSLVYRRTKAEMPARVEELHHALEETIVCEELTNPISFNGDENNVLKSVTLQNMCLGEPDESGRCRPQEIDGDTKEIPCELAIIAVGTRPNPIILEATPDLELNKWGYISVNEETGETSIPNVFAGGDIVTGAATVISAMGAGRRAGKAIAARFTEE
ncbi:MAG: NADPH-dependent glutamate synthase [Desulfovibrio sp.]